MNCNVVGDFSINCKISFIQNKINHFQLVRSYSYYEWQLLRKINIGPALLETKLENAKSNNSLVSTAISFHCYSLWWGICSILVSLFSCKYIMHTVYTHAKKFSRKKHSENIQTFLQIVRIPNDYFRLTLPWTGSNFMYFGRGGAHCTPPPPPVKCLKRAFLGSNQLVTKKVDKFWAVKWKKNFFFKGCPKKSKFWKKIKFFWPSKNK